MLIYAGILILATEKKVMIFSRQIGGLLRSFTRKWMIIWRGLLVIDVRAREGDCNSSSKHLLRCQDACNSYCHWWHALRKSESQAFFIQDQLIRGTCQGWIHYNLLVLILSLGRLYIQDQLFPFHVLNYCTWEDWLYHLNAQILSQKHIRSKHPTCF